jgi:hypothetical protein
MADFIRAKKERYVLTLPFKSHGGAMRDRTADLLRARQSLSQLSYSPMFASDDYCFDQFNIGRPEWT